MTVGSTQRTAMSRSASVARTACRHFDDGRELHLDGLRRADRLLIRHDHAAGIDDEPGRAACRTPERDDAVLPFGYEQCGVRLERRRRVGSDEAATSALSEVKLSTVSRPATMSTICVHWYAFPWNVTGAIGFDGVVPGPELHIGRAVGARDDQPRRGARRIVAEEERVARDRRRLVAIDQDDPYVQNARWLRRAAPESPAPASQGSARAAWG